VEKQEKKIELETMRVVVKKMREDFMILIADISNMDPASIARGHP
jgi:hypothetical protein